MIGTEVIVEGGNILDVYEGLDFSFNYSVSDIRRPDTRQTEFTKTIKLPATANNNTLFGNLFEADIANPFDPNNPNIGVNFNPNKKASVQVLQNSLPVLDGSMQLRKITVTKGRVEYEAVFIGRLIDIFGAWGDRKMNEVDETGVNIIDISDYDHALTDTVQAASWSATVGEGYVYPLIDYGRSFAFDSLNRREYQAADLRPAMYVRTLFNKIFEYAGATYEGDILNVTQSDGFDFDRLCIPFIDGFVLDPDDIADRTVLGQTEGTPATPTAPTYTGIPFLLGSGTGGFIFTFAFPENFGSQLTQTVGVSQTFVPAFNARYQVTGNMELRFIRTTATGNTGGTPIDFILTVNGVTRETIQSVPLPNIGSPNAIGSIFLASIPFSFAETDFEAGDIVTVTYNLTSADWDAINDNTDSEFLNGTFIRFQCVNESLFYGDNVYMNLGLPDLAIKDFFLSILKMFNMYMLPDKTIPNKYIFYTRDEFYRTGQLRDWTRKMDRGSAVEITPMGLLSGREYLYTYSEDGDYYNQRFQNNYGRTYGARRLDVDNDFVPQRVEQTIVFSPTPLVNDGDTSRIIPKIYDADISQGRKPTSSNVRILYYGGLLPSISSWFHVTPTTSTARSTYPYAGHWDNPITPSLDINFGLSLEYYYAANGATGTLQMTNNNLFKAYHERQFLELSNKDSKLVTAMFNLTALDIHQLDFRDTILIDQTYYRLNRVIDYNPFKTGLTKVELFKAGDIAWGQPESEVLGSGVAFSNGKLAEPAPTTQGKTLNNGNQFEPFQGTVIGTGNVVSPNAVGFIVQGDNNTVGASQNVTLIGSNNVVANGVSNVVAIGVNNLNITQSNTTYPECICVKSKTIIIPSAEVLTLFTTQVNFGLTVPAGYYAKPLGVDLWATFNSVPYATNTTLLIFAVGGNVDILNGDILAFAGNSSTQLTFTTAATDTQYVDGADLYVKAMTGDPTAGDSDITLVLTYILLPTP